MLRSDPEALRALRRRKGHSTRTLAARAELSHAAIVRLEKGAVPVKPDTADRLAEALGVEITDIATVVEQDAEAVT